MTPIEELERLIRVWNDFDAASFDDSVESIGTAAMNADLPAILAHVRALTAQLAEAERERDKALAELSDARETWLDWASDNEIVGPYVPYDEYEAIRAKLAAAEAVIAKLPKTADGVPVVPGMRVYGLTPARTTVWEEIVEQVSHKIIADEIYSTREAALAAKEAE